MNGTTTFDALSRSDLIELLEASARTSAVPSETPQVADPSRESSLSAVYDVVPTGIVETDLDQRIVRCNPAFASMVGLPVTAIVGRFGWNFFHPDSAPPDPSAVADLRAGRRTSYSAQRVLRHGDGSAMAVATDWAVVRDASGRVEELVCAVTDISAQVRTTVELRRAHERAETMWQQAPVGIIELTPDGLITSVNPSLAAMLAYDADDLVGTRVVDVADPADAVAIGASIRELVRSGAPVFVERRYLASDGRVVPVHVSAAVLPDEIGVADRVTAFVVDVTEAHAQHAALRDALVDIAAVRDQLADRQLFTDALLETIDVGIVSCDAVGTVVGRNSAERALLGLGQEHVDTPPDVAAPLFDILDATGARLTPEQYPLARALRGDDVAETGFRIGPRGGPYRDTVIRGTRITSRTEKLLGAVVAVTDVTAERNALRELGEEREALRNAQRLSEFGSFRFDVATQQFTTSPETLRIWGLPAGADLGARTEELIHRDDLARVTAHWNAAVDTGDTDRIDYRIVRPDGAVRHLRVSLEAVLDPSGRPVSVQGTHLDITDLAVARLRAVEANALSSAILAASPDLTFVTDLATGAVVYGSPGKAMLGLTAEDLMEFGPALIASVVHPDEQPRLRAMNVAARDLADGAVLELRYQARHTDGSWHWLDRRVTPFRRDPASGQVVEVLGVVRDVTDAYQTELALRDQEARFRALVTRVVDYAIVGLDSNGVIESWNDGAERLKGYSADQAIGSDFSMFYTAEDRAAGLPAQLLDRARKEGRTEHEGWRVRADGTRFWADVVITALPGEQGWESGFVKVTRDLTAQRQLAEAQDSFFAAISHDLITPIFTIKMYAELLGDVDAATKSDYARRIGAQAEHLTKLVEDLFEFAKRRTQPMAMTSVPLAGMTAACVAGIAPLLQHHTVVVAPTDLVAWADHTAMHRILTNLLSNATKYSPVGSTVTVAFTSSADRVCVSVTDRGRGIAPEDIATIFDEFSRGRLGQDDGGTGLGLASVQRMTSMQGGTAWIESELGHGTTVTVELARARPSLPIAGDVEPDDLAVR